MEHERKLFRFRELGNMNRAGRGQRMLVNDVGCLVLEHPSERRGRPVITRAVDRLQWQRPIRHGKPTDTQSRHLV